MSTKTAILCTKCHEVLNSEDDVFGTSCGHLYHFLCLRECHGRSTNCSHCESYKPCMFKMFVDFVEQPISWEDQQKTIDLHNELEEYKIKLFNLEEKYKFSQVAVQKLEGKLKKHNDTLKSKDITVSDFEDRIATLEELNKYLTTELELKTKNNEKPNNEDESMEQTAPPSSYKHDLSDQLEEEIVRNTKIEIENMKLKAFLNFVNNGTDSTNLNKMFSSNNKNENIEQSKEGGKFVSDTKTISEPPNNQNIQNKNTEENEEGTVSSNQENTSDSHTVLIRNYRIQNLKKPLETVVIEMASRMDINLSNSDIIRVIKIKNNSKTVSLIVAFRNIQLKQEFLKNKNRLKKFKSTKYLEICANIN